MILFEETENPRRPERLILEEAGDLAADQFRESATRLERCGRPCRNRPAWRRSRNILACIGSNFG
jgi:hypothetical protein